MEWKYGIFFKVIITKARDLQVVHVHRRMDEKIRNALLVAFTFTEANAVAM